jgi:hypothetical protein
VNQAATAKIRDEDGYKWKGPVFSADVVEKIDNGKAFWDYVTVGVYQQDEKDGPKKLLGTFERNYSTNFRNFSWCRKGNRFFALYSPKYTCTRVMEIFPGEGFKDIGGEESIVVEDSYKNSNFCPTDLYILPLTEYVSEAHHVPNKYKDWAKLLENFPAGTYKSEFSASPERQSLYYPDGKRMRAYKSKDKYEWVYGPERPMESGFVHLPPKHAFVAGCVWGDDSTWKIQYIDVSRIDEGIIKREERFGYIELPSHLTLKKAIELEEDGDRLSISITLTFDINTGNPLIEKSLFNKFLEGQKVVEKQDKEFYTYRQIWNSEAEELYQRWQEQGKRIQAELEATGGRIG